MKGLSYALRALNSNEDLRLLVDRLDDDEIALCIIGKYEEKPIQIDFEPLDPRGASDLAEYIRLRVSQPAETEEKSRD